MPDRIAQAPRVVIVGCGFGGIEAVRALSRAAVDITLVDRTNHHLFQPLLYQVATAGLSAPAISAPIRHILRKEMARGNLTILQAEVTDIDIARRQVALDGGQSLGYEHLIVAAGATHSYFGHDDWQAHAPGLKTLADAFAIRSRVIGAFEQAERCSDPAARETWLTFAVIGGGPTGVEMAGTLIEIARHTLPAEYRRIDSASARVVLLEGSDHILGTFGPKLSQKACDQLVRLGVDVRTGCHVTDIDADGVEYDRHGGQAKPGGSHQRLACKTVVWAAGVAASSLGKAIAAGAGVAPDRAGRVVVEPDLSLPGHPEVSVVGDLAAAKSYPKGHRKPEGDGKRQDEPKPVPGVSPGAKQMGRAAARNLLRRLQGQPTEPFHYTDYGNLATIGRSAAVVDLSVPLVGDLRFSGFIAWLFWLVTHIWFLIGFRNRLMVMTNWGWSYFTYQRSARVVAVPPAGSRRSAAPP